MAKLAEVIPEDLRSREYMKPFLELEQGPEAFSQVFKKLDGAESLLGKRPAIPAKDAKPEELEKFFSQWTPEKAEEYEIPLTEGAPKPNEDYLKAVRNAFHAGKLSKNQAQTVLKVMNEFGLTQQKAQQSVVAKKNLEFDTLAKTMLGEKNKEVMERVRKALNEFAPSAAKANLDKITDDNLVVMAAVIDGVMKKYVPEDQLKGMGKASSGSIGSGAGAKEKRAEAMKLMESKAYTSWQDPEHEATVAKVKAIYQELQAAGQLPSSST